MNSTSSENDPFGDVTSEGIMSGTSNTAIGGDPRRFLVDGSGNVCVGDEVGTGWERASVTASRSDLLQVLLQLR